MVALPSFPKRFEVYLVELDPTRGSEIRKTRPCVVVSPDEVNRYLRTVIVAPMTTAGKAYATRVEMRFSGRDGFVALDQLRSVDRSRLQKRVGRLQGQAPSRLLSRLQEMFAP